MHTHHHADEGAASTSDRSCSAVHPDNDVYHPEGHPPPRDPVDEARRILAKDERARVEACAEEISQVLATHGMRLEVSPAHIVISPAD